MLTELHIRDLALIDDLELTFGPGLNALTGETGSGKSLIVTALELLAAERPKGGPGAWVRRGARRARIDARFTLPDGPAAARLQTFLDEHLPELADEFREQAPGAQREVIIGRTLEAVGRTRAHANGAPVTQRALRGLAECLFEVQGQNTHQRLLDPAHQRELLDAFSDANSKTIALRDGYAEERAGWLAVRREVAALAARANDVGDRLELLGYQADELARAEVAPAEKASLLDERERLRHAGELSRDLGAWIYALDAADDAMLARLRDIERSAMVWSGRIAELKAPCEELLEGRLRLEESVRRWTSFADGIEVDPERLEVVETRLAEIERLEQKYSRPADELDDLSRELGAERDSLELGPAELEAAREREGQSLARMTKLAKRLTKARKSGVKPLADALAPVLAHLGLEAARFDVRISPRGADASNVAKDAQASEGEGSFGPHGTDRVEFLLAANPGEPLGPLSRVASGGEAARILLALRSVLAGCDEGRTLLFDEIDSGVGGRLGPELGCHLHRLGQHHQVVSVTHLPSIAAAADHHLRVEKGVEEGRTRTRVAELAGSARVREIADMISGGGQARTALAEARRLLNGAA